MLTFWIRPAAALLFWLLLAATTLSELGTLPPPHGHPAARVSQRRFDARQMRRRPSVVASPVREETSWDDSSVTTR
jgi:hypothetical protein